MIEEIVILLIVFLVNGFFAASEMAIVSARRARLKQRVDEEGDTGAKAALELAEDNGRFLSSVQIGITVLGVFAGAYGGANLAAPLGVHLQLYFPEHADDVAFGLVVTFITYFSLVIGELVPKRLALAHAEGLAAAIARPMQIFATIGSPFVTLLNASSNALLHLLPFRSNADSGVTEEEVKNMIAEGTDAGVFERAEQQMLEGVLRMGDRSVRAIMTPRPDVIWLDITQPVDVQLAKLTTIEFSRLPVMRGTPDSIVGIIYAKDLLNAYLRGVEPDIEGMVRDALTVHDAMPVLRLVDLFRTTRQHMAIVVDEHGSVEGLVTTTDVLEAVTGHMPENQTDSDSSIVIRGDGSFLVDAMMPVDEVAAHLGLRGMKTDDDDFHTLAGFVLKQLGHLPKTGEHFMWEAYGFEVLDMDGRRVDKMLITPPAITTED